MKSYRFTYRSEIYVEAETPQEAFEELHKMSLEDFKDKSDFIEWECAEDADTYDDVWGEINA